MPISGNVQRRVIAAPRLVSVHLRGEVEKKLLAECLGAFSTRDNRRIEAPINNLVKVDFVWFPIDQRDASRSHVCLGDAAVPVSVPRVVSQMNG